MDIDAIVAAANAGELLSEEEFAFLEKKLLESTRTLFQMLTEISDKAEEAEPELAHQLRNSAASMLRNVELAASLDGRPRKLEEA